MKPAGLSAPEGLAIADASWSALREAYARPPRFYHTFDHVIEVATHYDRVAADVGWQRPREVYLAVLFHDVIYEFGRSDNEARSAEYAREAIRRWFPDGGIDSDLVAQLIERTAEHGKLTPDTTARDEALFLDCDIAILAATTDRFDRYQSDVQAEYTQVYTLAQYSAGRRGFLTALLAADRIFLSDYFHRTLDASARANLRRALAD